VLPAGTPFQRLAIISRILLALACIPTDRDLPSTVPIARLERAGYVVGTVAGMAVLLGVRSRFPVAWLMAMIGVSLLGGVLVMIGWVQAATQVRSPANGQA